MVRTKADSGAVKVSAAKAPRKMSSGASSSSSTSSPSRSGSSKDKYSGGNPYNPQPIPKWQKGISTFFKSGSSESNDSIQTSSSSNDNGSPVKQSTSKESLGKNGIISDDDDD
ncbi:PCNA-associated factor [Armadillidium nasatum]|uniref:PCNA-associated factor n=1 Tax=Armadillidium nasatum TaxID=96803 RepID=A0A5N5SN41_9CRUS|nr:PCNA-associated factor [Armadillidium nasatum]